MMDTAIDRYAVIIVSLKTGTAATHSTGYEGDDGAEEAHKIADRLTQPGEQLAMVIGLR